jgi:hypothetical protein
MSEIIETAPIMPITPTSQITHSAGFLSSPATTAGLRDEIIDNLENALRLAFLTFIIAVMPTPDEVDGS